MSEDHPDPRLLERFMRNEVDGEERRGIVRHLLGGCARCVAVTRSIWNLGEPRADDPLLADPLEDSGMTRRPPLDGSGGRISRRLAEVLDFPRAERRERIGA
jgi:hypothetical protein